MVDDDRSVLGRRDPRVPQAAGFDGGASDDDAAPSPVPALVLVRVGPLASALRGSNHRTHDDPLVARRVPHVRRGRARLFLARETLDEAALMPLFPRARGEGVAVSAAS